METTLYSPATAVHENNLNRTGIWSRYSLSLLLGLWLLIYFASLFSPPLLDDADATHAQAALHMAQSGDWVTLHVNGIRYLEKAPLPYWLAAIWYKIFGANVFSTHLPLALAVLATALLAGAWGRRAFGELAGTLAALFTLTSVGYFLFTRIFIPEAILSLLIAAALYCALRAMEQRSATFAYRVYIFAALAVLTKGLVALAFIFTPLLLMLIITGEWRRWREFRLLTGGVIFLLIAAPWHLLAGIRNPGFFWFYFVNEHFLRFIGKRYPKDYNKLPAAAYWLLHFVWLFPWSLFVPVVARDLWQRWQMRRQKSESSWDFGARTRLLCALCAGFVLVFFAFSTNQEYYTFPAYFPLVLLAAATLSDARWRSSRLALAAYSVLALTSLAACAALIAGLWSSRSLPFQPDISSVMAQRGVGDYTLSMSHFFDLTGASFAGLRLPAAMAALAFLFGPVAVLWLQLRRRTLSAMWTAGLTVAVFCSAAHIALARFGPFLGSSELAEAASASIGDVEDDRAQPGIVALYGDQSYGSSFIFYLRARGYPRDVKLVNGRSSSMLWGSRYPDAPPIFWEDIDLLRAWDSDMRVVLFVPAEQHDHVRQLFVGRPAHLLARSSGKELLSNR